jgi:rubrerythrin
MPKRYLSEFPLLIKEWDDQKNCTNPSNITYGSGLKVWWKCSDCGHSWQAKVNSRTKESHPTGCPECSKKNLGNRIRESHLIKKGISVFDEHPNLMKEWDFSKNTIDPHSITSGSSSKVWWKCANCGNSWLTNVNRRTAKSHPSGCPECSRLTLGDRIRESIVNRKGITLFDEYPDLMKEWDYSKNNIDPKSITSGSDAKAWWTCSSCGYSWKANIGNRTSRKSGCPSCAKNTVIQGKNDLKTKRPDLLEEWDYSKNTITPSSVSEHSGKKVWWNCSVCGESWYAPVSDRSSGHGCPACGGTKRKWVFEDIPPLLQKEWDFDKNKKKIEESSIKASTKHWWKCSNCGNSWKTSIRSRLTGYSACPSCSKPDHPAQGSISFADKMPELLPEWDNSKNKETPNEVPFGSNKKYWWKCSFCGNEWKAAPNDRIYGRNCPNCAKTFHSSFPEQALFYYVKMNYSSAINGYHVEWLKQREFDIFVPELKLAIEYDGNKWHTSSKKDIEKELMASSHGITLIHLREEGCPELLETSISFPVKTGSSENTKNLQDAMSNLFHYLEVSYGSLRIKPNLEEDRLKILAMYESHKKERSLKVRLPEIAKEWNYEKNQGLSPSQVTFSSSKSVWWKCSKCGYEWTRQICRRADGDGCPVCANLVIISGYNDLRTAHPEILKEWNFEKNSKGPEYYAPNTTRKVWWKCASCGNEWEASIANRTRKSNPSGCPNCAKEKGTALFRKTKLDDGRNSLANKYPRLLVEWNYARNTIDPMQITPGCKTKVWWKCINGHEWESAVGNRVRGSGCPFCWKGQIGESTRKAKMRNGVVSFAEKHPELLKEWDYEKNMIKPTEITSGSGLKVWWNCSRCGLSWETMIVSRSKGHGCPRCRKTTQ